MPKKMLEESANKRTNFFFLSLQVSKNSATIAFVNISQ